MAKKPEKNTLSRADVLELVGEFRAQLRHWEEADEPVVQWRGRESKVISQALCESAVALFDAVETQWIEQDAWELCLGLDRFQKALTAWAQKVESSPMTTDPQGGTAVWGPWNDVLRLLEPRRRRRPSPIRSLEAEKVSHRQIAKEYGWYLPDGTPDERKVIEEITEPGKHYDEARYIHPNDEAHDARIQQAWEQRCEGLGKESEFGRKSRGVESFKPTREWRKPPETIEQLLKQGVPLNQIARMHRVDLDEVKAEAAAIGLWTDAEVVRYARENIDQAFARREQLEMAKINSHPEYGQSLEERVLAISLDGHPPDMVARVLQRNGFGEASKELVTSILQRIDSEQPEATEATA